MESDWEVEIGGQAPILDACWEGLVDLRRSPQDAALLPEARELPALADALVKLNSPSSPVWTAKCDVWRPPDFDRDELDARPGEAKFAMACYIDLLPRQNQRWPSPEKAVADCRAIGARLRSEPLRCCRADLIVRRAHLMRSGRTWGSRRILPPAERHGTKPARHLRPHCMRLCGWYSRWTTPRMAVKSYNEKDGRVAQSDRAPAF